MASSTSTAMNSTANSSSSSSTSESAITEYLREYIDYQENGVDLTELSQIRQLDLYLQNCYSRVRELVESLQEVELPASSKSEIQTKLINALIQAKTIGDKKMQLSQQMLDTVERQSRKLKISQQKYNESINQQTTSTETTSNDIDSDNETDAEIVNPRNLNAKNSATSLWKRKATTNNASNSTLNQKRKCVTNNDHNSEQRDRKRTTQRNINSTNQNSANSNGKRIKLSTDLSSSTSEEPTYCLCSQLSYGSMILCDSKACDIKWFHFNCVNLTTKPKGKWYCPNCRDGRS